MHEFRFQFSLRLLFGFITIAGIGCAALANPSYIWAGVILTIALGMLAMAGVGAACCYGSCRAFCLGAVIFGSGYMILTLAPWFDDATGELLPSRMLLDYLGTALGHDVSNPETMPGIWRNLPHSRDGRIGSYVYLTYLMIGHSLISLVLALIGGCLGGLLHARSKPASN